MFAAFAKKIRMNRFLFSFLLIFFCQGAFCQFVYPYQDIKLEKPADYKATESVALSAATFILTTPFIEKDVGRGNALKFLANWMTGAKDYNFYMEGVGRDISDEKDLLSLYLAGMVKFSLENKAEAVNPLKVELNAIKLVLAYCDDTKNNFKLKKKYRKVLEKN